MNIGRIAPCGIKEKTYEKEINQTNIGNSNMLIGNYRNKLCTMDNNNNASRSKSSENRML